MNNYELSDVYRTLHNDNDIRKYSWRRFNGTQRSRLDYFLVSEHLGLDIASADIMPGYYSDHSLVCVGFKTDIIKRHRPLWKFNNSLLRDKTCVYLVKQVILDLKKEYALPVYDRNNIHLMDDEELVLTINDQLFFLMILLKITGSCISYCSFRKKEETRMEDEIMSSIKYLELEDNFSENNVHRLEQKKQELIELRKTKSWVVWVRSLPSICW